MSKKAFVLFSLVAAQALWAFVSPYGGRGNYRVLTARCDRMGTFGLNLHGEYYYEEYQDTVLAQVYHDLRHFGEGRANLSYTIFKFIEMNGTAIGTVRYDQKEDIYGLPGVLRKDAYSYGWKGFGGGLKVGHHLLKSETRFTALYLGAKLGLESGTRLPRKDTALVNRGFPKVYGHELDYDYRLLAGFEFGALGINGNIGRIDKGRSWNTRTYREDKIFYGLTADLNIRDRSSLFGEIVNYHGAQSGDSVFGIGGIKLGLAPGMTIDAIFMRGITNAQDWVAAGGITLSSSLLPDVPVEKKTASLLGGIVDSEDQEPLEGIVSFPGSKINSVMSGSDGRFNVVLPGGAYLLHVEAPGYEPKERPVTIKAGQAMVSDFELKKKGVTRTAKVGRITGRVIDDNTGEPVSARIELLGSDLGVVRAEPSTGRFSIRVAPASYYLVVTAQGYSRQERRVEIDVDEEVNLEFALEKAGEVTSLPTVGKLTGRVVDSETEAALNARISLLGTSYQTQSANGAYELAVMPGVYRVITELAGYHRREEDVMVKAGEVINLNIVLRKEAKSPSVYGGIYDAATGNPISALITFKGARDWPITSDPATGIFQVDLPAGDYRVNVEAAGFSAQDATLALNAGELRVISFYLEPGAKPAPETRVVLREIYFRYGDAELGFENYFYLDELLGYLGKNPSLILQIDGHTDSVGDETSNLLLSQRRAEAVRNYLMARGIDPARLYVRGFGESMPVGDNRRLSGREMNRRVEFNVVR